MSNLDGPPYYDSGLGDVPVPGAVAPLGLPPDGSFGSMRTSCVVGGAKMVNDLTSRDAIPSGLRAEGMICYVQSTGLTYQLVGGILNANWTTFAGATPTLAQVLVAGNTSGATNLLMAARLEEAKGADVASATTITLGDGNYFQITGTTTIDGITTTNWQSGSVVTLYFVSTPTVTNNSGAPGVNAAKILTATGSNFTAAAGNMLTLRYDSSLSAWQEESRAVAGAAAGTWASVLTSGNTSGATNPVITNGQAITGETLVGTGGTLPLRGGLATLAAGAGGPVTVSTAASGAGTTYVERLRVTAAGCTDFGDGTLAAAFAGGSSDAALCYRNAATRVSAYAFENATASASPNLLLGRSRGTAAVPAIVVSGDSIGRHTFAGALGAAAVANFALMEVVADTTVTVSSAPGRIVMSTTPSGSTAPVERVRIDNAGTLFVGNGTLAAVPTGTTPTLYTYLNSTNRVGQATYSTTDAPLHQFIRGRGTAAAPTLVANGDSLGQISFNGMRDATTPSNAADIFCIVDGTTSSADVPGALVFRTTLDGAASPTERLRINNAGTTFFGDGTLSSTLAAGGQTTYSYRNAANPNVVAAFSAAAASTAPTFQFLRGRGTAAASTIVSSGDLLGQISFAGIQAANSGISAGVIQCSVDGTPGASNDMPGRLEFYTTADGSGTATERMRINHAGVVFVGDGTLAAVPTGTTQALYTYRNAANLTGLATYSTTDASLIMMIRGRGTAAAPALVSNGDVLGQISFNGMRDATTASNAADIICTVDGSPSSADVPGAMAFRTTVDGAATPTERMRIDNAGVIYAGNGATSATPSAATIRGTGGSGSGVAGATLTISGGANSGSGNSNGGGLTLVAPTANAAGTNGALTLTQNGASYTFNDSSNTSFTGSATGATSLVGAINQVAAGTGTGAVIGIGSARGTGTSRTLATLPSNLITAAGDRIELEARGDIDNAGTFLFAMGGTTLFTSTSVAPGGAPYVATFTLVRVTDTTADWFATLLVEGSVVYADGATAATVPSLTGINATPNCSVTGATSSVLNLVGTAIKA